MRASTSREESDRPEKPTRVSKPASVDALRRAARRCRACPLWKPATQTVFGEGPANARIMLIGEQPGDREDLAGEPFVGPSGRVLDQALDEIGATRERMYVTNVVKHFKFEQRGKRRLHKRANAAEIEACSRWLEGELDSVRPRYVVCLGSMAAQAMLGRAFKLKDGRGHWQKIGDNRWCLATVHPSAVLRARIGGGYDEAFRAFVDDLAKINDRPRR